MLSAVLMVDNLWAITIVVLPALAYKNVTLAYYINHTFIFLPGSYFLFEVEIFVEQCLLVFPFVVLRYLI